MGDDWHYLWCAIFWGKFVSCWRDPVLFCNLLVFPVPPFSLVAHTSTAGVGLNVNWHISIPLQKPKSPMVSLLSTTHPTRKKTIPSLVPSLPPTQSLPPRLPTLTTTSSHLLWTAWGICTSTRLLRTLVLLVMMMMIIMDSLPLLTPPAILTPPNRVNLPHKVKMQYVHFRSHTFALDNSWRNEQTTNALL